jgi:phosphotransferase system  glucose/maltose/N-acetylglucosamine-specific IIC component/phosphotransferase system IIB component
MRRWYTLIEILQFPLQVLFLAMVLMGLSGVILNPNFNTIFLIDNKLVIMMAELFRYFGGFIIMNFPLLILIKALAKRYDDSVVVFIGILGYAMFHVAMLFFAPTNLPAEAYYAFLGIQVNTSVMMNPSYNGLLVPLQTGIIGLIIVLSITRFAYHSSRNRFTYGSLGFVDRNVQAAIITILFSLLAGVVVAFIWPYFIRGSVSMFTFLSEDLNNPINLFIYGVLDRLYAVFNMSGLLRGLFWFTSLGGTWINAFGQTFLGDINVWVAQTSISVFGLGAGRLITPYFVLNIFAIPSMLVGIYGVYTDKMERRRFRLFFLLAALISILSGTLLPLEIFLLICAPLLFMFHIFMTGALFALFSATNVYLGYSFSGNVLTATPGSIIDMIVYWRNIDLFRPLLIIVMVGLITGILYFAATTYYFRKGAVNLIDVNELEHRLTAFLASVGGIENIRMIHASPTKLTVQVFDRSVVDFSKIHHHDVSRIVETRAGYSLSYGAPSYMLRHEVAKLQKLLPTQSV